jgi:hypothetical protein
MTLCHIFILTCKKDVSPYQSWDTIVDTVPASELMIFGKLPFSKVFPEKSRINRVLREN